MKSLKILCISLISLQSMTASSFEMTEPELRQSIRRYLSIYDNVDENIINNFVELVNRHSDLFNHLAEIKTDPEFLPYIEKYSNLKVQFTGRPIDEDVKVVFSSNPLRPSSNYNESFGFSGSCDFFTRIVFIDRSSWNHYRENERIREALLSHEIGHCDLNRNHRWEGDFSFMSAGVIDFLLLPQPPTLADLGYDEEAFQDQEERLSYQLTYQLYLDARNHLDETFTEMYQELFFSVENTRTPCDDRLTSESSEVFQDCMNPIEELNSFENHIFHPRFATTVSVLKHMTIGPVLEGGTFSEAFEASQQSENIFPTK